MVTRYALRAKRIAGYVLPVVVELRFEESPSPIDGLYTAHDGSLYDSLDSHFLYSSASEATIARQAIIDAAGTYDHDY